ncbi:hypothetical protein [Vibrio crassostreae]|uniref:hypothetical protein n=1 Tax=Vibrio crassostreae TaxID=246167 RepID=UPI002FE048D6
MIYIASVVVYILPVLFFFKSNLLKILLLTLSYPIALIFLLAYDVDLGRIISSLGLNYYSDHLKHAHYLTSLSYFIVLCIFWSCKKKTFSLKVLTLGNFERAIIFLFFLAIAFIAFPRAMGISDIRYNLLPGSWGGVFNVLSIILIYTARRSKDIFTILVYLIIAKCFISGERADTSIAILLAFMLKNDNGVIKERSIGIIKFMVLCAVAVCTGVLVGAYRTGVNYTNAFDYLISSIFGIGTVVDVIHVYLSSLWYVDKYGNNVDAVFNIIYTIIPFVDGGGVSSDYNFTWLLKNEINNVGGGLFYTPFYLAFSDFGMLLFIVAYFYFVRYSFFSSNYFVKYIFVILIVMQCRIQWYGMTYPFTAIKLMLMLVLIISLLKKISGVQKYER